MKYDSVMKYWDNIDILSVSDLFWSKTVTLENKLQRSETAENQDNSRSSP